MYYDKVYKVQGYVLFDNLKADQQKMVLKKMGATPLKRLDWPGTSFIKTAEDFAKNRGYGEHLKFDGTPFTMDRDLILRLAQEHIKKSGSGLANLNPDSNKLRTLNRVVSNNSDYARLFDDFLACCVDESICFSLDTQLSPAGLWGMGLVVGQFDLNRIAEHVATVGNGPQYTFDLKTEPLAEVLEHLVS